MKLFDILIFFVAFSYFFSDSQIAQAGQLLISQNIGLPGFSNKLVIPQNKSDFKPDVEPLSDSESELNNLNDKPHNLLANDSNKNCILEDMENKQRKILMVKKFSIVINIGDNEHDTLSKSQALNSRQINELRNLNIPCLSINKGDIVLSQLVGIGNSHQRASSWKFSLDQLFQISTAITNFYRKKGYSTSGAVVVLPHDWETNSEVETVTIKIIEGQLKQLTICKKIDSKAEQQTQKNSCDLKFQLSDYVEERLGIEEGKPLNTNRLKENLQILQLDPLIQQISATVTAGVEPGDTRLEVRVIPEGQWALSIRLDNARPPSVGSFQRQLILDKTTSLLPGDRWNSSYRNTDGSNALDVSYAIPVNVNDGRLTLRYSRTESSIIEEPFDILDIEADADTYEISFRQPLIQKVNEDRRAVSVQAKRSTSFEEVAVGMMGYLRDSRTELLGAPFPLSSGSEADGRTRIVALRFFQDWSRRSAEEVFAARSELSLGLNILDATTNSFDFLPSSDFIAWRGQVQYVRLLGSPNRLLVSRFSTQFSNQPLFSSEQFAAGGSGTVRGYREDILQSDNGILGSVEVRWPILRLESREPSTLLQLIPFVDGAYGWNNGNVLDPDPNSLISVGLGLQLTHGSRFLVRLDYGIPLISDGLDGNSLQESGLHLFVQFKAL